MRGAGLLCLWAVIAFAQAGSIEGVAVNAVTGQPLAGVHVRLIRGVFNADVTVYGAITDRSGHFSVATMPAGAYMLAPEFPGFLYSPPQSDSAPVPVIQILAGQPLEGYKLEMTPAATLSGRVVDEYGDPVANVLVQASAVSGNDRIPIFGGGNYPTNDRGEFRVATAPGKYYLLAEAFTGSSEAPETRTDGTSDAPYGTTFYPNAASQDRASPIEAAAGKDVRGLEIRLLRMRTFTISGMVTGVPDSSGRTILVMRYGAGERQLYNSRSTSVGPDGRFSFGRLPPGFYRIHAAYSSGQTRLQSGTVDVRLDSADETGLQLTLAAGGELAGTLQLEGLPAARRSVRLDSSEMPGDMNQNGTPLAAEVAADGSFKIAGLPPGKYKVIVEPMPEDGYVKTVQLDGAAVPGDVIDLSRGARGSRLKITASGNAAQISGKVLDKAGRPITNSVSVVFLMTGPKEAKPEAVLRVTPEGTYSQKGIRPGKYRLFALDIFHYTGGRGSLDNDFSEPFSLAEEIEIKEGDKVTKDLKVLEKEAANGRQ